MCYSLAAVTLLCWIQWIARQCHCVIPACSLISSIAQGRVPYVSNQALHQVAFSPLL